MMGYESYFDDVQEELHEMRRINKVNRALLWIAVPVGFLAHAVALALIVSGVTWIFGGSPSVVGVTCAAYVCAVLGWALQRIQQKSVQMAIHATSVHDEVLRVKELILEEQRKTVQWKY
jgi:hypothetical protein